MGKALPLYQEAVRRNPKFAVGLQKLGIALRLSGQYTEAAEFLKRAASRSADNAFTWHELGLTYRAQGKMPDAVAALERAIALDPDMSEAHNNLGIIRFAGGEQARAESAFREAIRIQPDYVDAHNKLGNLLSGTAISSRRAITSKLRFGCGQTTPAPGTTMPWPSGGHASSMKHSFSWRRACGPIPSSRMPTSFWRTC